MTRTSNRFATSNRRAELPSNWKSLRKIVARRADYQCEWVERGRRCQTRGTDCDHIGDRHDHRLSNLRWLCHPHHEVKTKEEAAAGRRRNSPLRPVKPHIGRINP